MPERLKGIATCHSSLSSTIFLLQVIFFYDRFRSDLKEHTVTPCLHGMADGPEGCRRREWNALTMEEDVIVEQIVDVPEELLLMRWFNYQATVDPQHYPTNTTQQNTTYCSTTQQHTTQQHTT